MTLRIDTNIPCGNACDVLIDQSGEAPRVEFAADPHGGPECLWFCFRLVADAPVAAGKVRLVLKHACNMLGGHVAENMRPVVRRAAGAWERLGPGEGVMLPDGRWTVEWTMDAPEGHADVAWCYPYGRPELDRLLADTGEYWRAETIGVSQGSRPIVRLSNAPGEPGGARPGLYLTARQHSGETPGSWVLDGALRRLAELGEAAPLVWAVPLTNIDGVEQGDYGKDNFPHDLNRAWGNPPMRHEVLVMQRDVRRWQERCRPACAIDFHAPGGSEKAGVYFFIPDPEREPDAHAAVMAWVDPLAAAIGPDCAAEDYGRVARYPSRWGTASFRHFFQTLGVPGLCQETPYALAGETVLTIDRYREIGRRVADALVSLAR